MCESIHILIQLSLNFVDRSGFLVCEGELQLYDLQLVRTSERTGHDVLIVTVVMDILLKIVGRNIARAEYPQSTNVGSADMYAMRVTQLSHRIQYAAIDGLCSGRDCPFDHLEVHVSIIHACCYVSERYCTSLCIQYRL